MTVDLERLKHRLRQTRENFRRIEQAAEINLRTMPTKKNELQMEKVRGYGMALDAVDAIIREFEPNPQQGLFG